jgi:hypothetical protein
MVSAYDRHVQYAIAYVDYIDDWTWQAYGWMIGDLTDWLFDVGWFN